MSLLITQADCLPLCVDTDPVSYTHLRTYATILESLDCPPYPLKALLGHSMGGDVTTEHYTQITVARIRPWAEKYEALILQLVSKEDGVSV